MGMAHTALTSSTKGPSGVLQDLGVSVLEDLLLAGLTCS